MTISYIQSNQFVNRYIDLFLVLIDLMMLFELNYLKLFKNIPIQPIFHTT